MLQGKLWSLPMPTSTVGKHMKSLRTLTRRSEATDWPQTIALWKVDKHRHAGVRWLDQGSTLPRHWYGSEQGPTVHKAFFAFELIRTTLATMLLFYKSIF